MVTLSVIIATHNRANTLAGCLMALSEIDFDQNALEVIVADNGSTDDTAFVADSFQKLFPHFRYIFDPRPGQIVGWHQALSIAAGDILAFIDDDVRPLPHWGSAAVEIFNDPAVGLGTGKILPDFAEKPPSWQGEMVLDHAEGTWSALWGMLDFGETRKEITSDFVWGSNFLVRKTALIESGGFHPGSMPQRLFHFTGDGDVAAGRQMAALGYRAHYHPDAAVAHLLSPFRNTADEQQRWIYGEGLVTSYVAIRKVAAMRPELSGGALAACASEALGSDRITAIGRGYLKKGSTLPAEIERIMETAGPEGYRFHQRVFSEDPRFQEWVLQPNYLDIDRCYSHPDLQPPTSL